MTIKLNSSISGHRVDKNGRRMGVFAHAAGAEVEWHDDAEAKRMIESGLATEVKKSNSK